MEYYERCGTGSPKNGKEAAPLLEKEERTKANAAGRSGEKEEEERRDVIASDWWRREKGFLKVSRRSRALSCARDMDVEWSAMEEFQLREGDFYIGTIDLLKSVDLSDLEFSSFTGLTSGIPTRTTATLTPTTLKNIEESFLELQSVPPAPMEHQHQAGFVPPVVNIAQYHQQNGSQGPSVNVKQEIPEDEWLPSQQGTSSSRHSSSAASSSSPAPSVTPVPPSKSGRTGGGRRPNRSEKLSPEEEERRRVRRERNKLAAARCRKRRMDHTNSLLKVEKGCTAFFDTFPLKCNFLIDFSNFLPLAILELLDFMSLTHILQLCNHFQTKY